MPDELERFELALGPDEHIVIDVPGQESFTLPGSPTPGPKPPVHVNVRAGDAGLEVGVDTFEQAATIERWSAGTGTVVFRSRPTARSPA